jgi:Asp-tRNA(Asn)/Glu-tRNA(Gln) amidotransferase A subunit family amidase
LRLALLGGYFENNASEEAWQAVEAAAKALGVTRTVALSEVDRARAAAFVITASEGGELHLPRLRTRRRDFDPLVRDRLTAGALVPAAWYLHAQRVRQRFAREVAKVFEDVDVLLAPATPTPATPIGQETFEIRGRIVPLRPNIGLLTQPLSFIGLPVAVAPLATCGLPLGVQIIAAPWREDLCLRVAAAFESIGVVRTEESLEETVSAS